MLRDLRPIPVWLCRFQAVFKIYRVQFWWGAHLSVELISDDAHELFVGKICIVHFEILVDFLVRLVSKATQIKESSEILQVYLVWEAWPFAFKS